MPLIPEKYFLLIGDYIKTKYEEAIRVKVNRKKRLQVKNSDSRKAMVTDLVYIHPSPSYCEKNETFGILGNQGNNIYISDFAIQ